MQHKLFMQADNIIVMFGEQKVLNFDRFVVYQGERIGLVGANGAGKTTLLRVLAGELERRIVTEWLPTSGYEYGSAPDIEVYLNPDPQNAQYEVWIPVVKR